MAYKNLEIPNQNKVECEVNKILDEEFSEHYRNIKCDFYKGVWLPQEYLKIANEIEDFKVRDDDVWVCSFPRSGTTWTQEMVWCIVNNLDYEKSKIPIVDRFFYLESSGTTTAIISMTKKGLDTSKYSIDYANRLPSPRFFKCHLPYHLLPKNLRLGNTKAKIVYITRNSKDVCISYYHLRANTKIYYGTLENYCKLFLGNRRKMTCSLKQRLAYTPYWEHLIGYWKAKDSVNIHFIKFEDMKMDLPSVIKTISGFFDKSFSDEEIETLLDHLSFEKMKSNAATNAEVPLKWMIENVYNAKQTEVAFIRKGQIDQWKVSMSEDLIKKFDYWIAERLKDYPDLKAHLL